MKKPAKKILFVLLSLALVICNMGNRHFSQAAENITKVSVNGEELYDEAYKILNIVNKERKANGKKSLTMNKKLMEAAMIRSSELTLYFSHTRPNKSNNYSIINRQDLNYSIIGENIARGQENATDVMNGWMNSPGHRSNILDESFTSIGIGVYKNNNGMIYFTQIFSDVNSTTPPQPENKKVTSYIDISDSLLNVNIGDKNLYEYEYDNPYMKINEERQLYLINFNSSYTFLNNYNIKWASSDETVAKVSQDGLVTSLNEGTVTITAIVGNTKKSSYKIIVKDNYDFDENLYDADIFDLSLTKKTSTSLSLSWNKIFNMNVDGYELSRATSSKGDYKPIAYIDNSSPSCFTLNYTDTKLTTGNTYYYKVRGYKYVNRIRIYGNFSTTLSGKTVLSKPVTSIKRPSSYNSINLNWKSVYGASGYDIYKSNSKTKDYIKVKNIENNYTLSYKDTKVTLNKIYYYKIKAYKYVNGKKVYSNYSNPVSGEASLTTPTISLTSGSKKAYIKWKKISGASGYEIYRSTIKNGKYSNIKTIKSNSTTSYTNTNLSSKKGYYYKVRAYIYINGKKMYSYFSNVRYIKTK